MYEDWKWKHKTLIIHQWYEWYIKNQTEYIKKLLELISLSQLLLANQYFQIMNYMSTYQHLRIIKYDLKYITSHSSKL